MRKLVAAALVALSMSSPGSTAAIIDNGARRDAGLSFFKQAARQKQDSNLIVSPLSASLALSMTLNGADGSTKAAMMKALGYSGVSIPEINQDSKDVLQKLRAAGSENKVAIANALFCNPRIKFYPDFLNATRENYDAKVEPVLSLGPINDWVKQKTENKIPSLLDKLDPEAILVLLNAVYFKGAWMTAFDKQKTTDTSFQGVNGKTTTCRMMHAERKDFRYFETNDFQSVRLPYKGDELEMTLFLPKPGASLADVEGEMNYYNWNLWRDKYKSRAGMLGMPRFKVESSLDLKPTLSALGMAEAFEPTRANFRNMAETRGPTYISKAVQKTFMEVNEEGTEAAAATAVVISYRGMSMNPEKPFRMILDRPFILFITDQATGSVLFAGHINHIDQHQ